MSADFRRSSPHGATAVSFDDEPLICVDADDKETGYASKSACHDDDGRLHRALSVFLFNQQGEVLLQQRSGHKRLWPHFWANSCCSHPRRGEPVMQAAARRLGEELGVQAPLRFTHRFEYHARYLAVGAEHELCHVFVAASDAAVAPHPIEIAAVHWWAPAALDTALHDLSAPFTPWLRLEWAALRQAHWAVVQTAVAELAQRP